MYRALCVVTMLFALSSISSSAEEIPWERLGSEARSLHGEARKAGDLWTSIQLEAFTAAHKEVRVRLPAYLGRSEIIGDARFAFPDSIRNHWDRGEYVGVISGRRFHRIDGLGRPLQLSVPLPIWANRSQLNHSGSLLAVANDHGPQHARIAQIAAINADNGEVLWRRDVPLGGAPVGQQDALHDGLAVAEDGSAVAAAIYRRHGNHLRLVLATKDGQRIIPNLRRPRGVGPHGAWLIADHDRQTKLITAVGARDIDQAAVGPGVAVIRQGKDFFLVKQDGQISPYTPQVAIGNNPEVWAMGGWLIIGSGDGASAEPVTDLLGNVVEEGGSQAYTLALHRWTDVIADPDSAPQSTLTNTYSRCDFRPNTLYAWEGDRISLVDLNGEQPVTTPWLTSTSIVHGVWDHHHYTMVSHPEGRRSVYDNQGQELWHGACNDAWVHSRRGLLYRTDGAEGPLFTFVHLHVDPLQRREVSLQLPPGWWGIRTHQYQNFGVADSNEVWHTFDLETGQITQSVVKNPLVEFPRPTWWRGESNNYGRFWRLGGRLLHKESGPEAVPYGERLVGQDAFHAGRALFILDQSEDVLLFNRGGFEILGQVAADVIATDAAEQTLYLGRGHRRTIVAKLDRGPKLVTDLGPAPGEGRDLPSGSWKIDRQYRFMPPRGSQLQWDDNRAGFRPRQLRSGGPQNLIVITDSVIILVEPRALPLIASGV